MDRVFLKFKDDLIQHVSSNDKFLKFFHSKRSHVLVVLLIACYGNKDNATFENINSKIPNLICSRTSIKTILDQGVAKGLFLKKSSSRDKRKQLYKLTPENQKKMHDWVKRLQNIFS